MKKIIATLGRTDTFSDLAVKKYLADNPEISAQILYCETITSVFEDLKAKKCDFGVVPIENSTKTQGFVEETKEALLKFPVEIIEENLILPVRFSFLSNCEREQVSKIFAKKEARNQCLKFLRELSPAEIIPTDDNMKSFEKLKECRDYAAAVVPKHIFEANKKKYKFCVEDITDDADNNTRFLVMRNCDEACPSS